MKVWTQILDQSGYPVRDGRHVSVQSSPPDPYEEAVWVTPEVFATITAVVNEAVEEAVKDEHDRESFRRRW